MIWNKNVLLALFLSSRRCNVVLWWVLLSFDLNRSKYLRKCDCENLKSCFCSKTMNLCKLGYASDEGQKFNWSSLLAFNQYLVSVSHFYFIFWTLFHLFISFMKYKVHWRNWNKKITLKWIKADFSNKFCYIFLLNKSL
jgi:hypothetical protein